MKFVFIDKSPIEVDIITDILHQEHISYKIEEKHTPVITIPFVAAELITYNIEINTTLEYFDFINKIASKKIKELTKLENCYIKRCARKKKKGVENELV